MDIDHVIFYQFLILNKMFFSKNEKYLRKLLKYSNKASRIQIRNKIEAEKYLLLLDNEVNKLKENNFKFLLSCDGLTYQNPIAKDTKYFRPLFAMKTHKKIKEAKADDTNAVDFDVPSGTKIYAVESGIITVIKTDGKVGGNNPNYAGEDNYIYIYNASQNKIYCYRHIDSDSSIAKNSMIHKGQFLGLVGMTGYTITPHLHFVIYSIYKNAKYILKSLPIKFC